MSLGKSNHLSDYEIEAHGLHTVVGWKSAILLGEALALKIELGPKHPHLCTSSTSEDLPDPVQIVMSPSQADALVERLLLFLAESGTTLTPGRA